MSKRAMVSATAGLVLALAWGMPGLDAASTAKLVDNFEDGDIMNVLAKSGIGPIDRAWYAGCDTFGASKASPLKVEALGKDAAAGKAIHAAGVMGKTVGNNWVWAQLSTDVGEVAKPASLVPSTGITFRAKTLLPGGSVRFSCEGTVGGKKLAGTGASHCKLFQPTAQWTTYTILWTEMAQPSWVCPGGALCAGALTVDQVVSLNWSFTGEGQAFDLWLDDVALVY